MHWSFVLPFDMQETRREERSWAPSEERRHERTKARAYETMQSGFSSRRAALSAHTEPAEARRRSVVSDHLAGAPSCNSPANQIYNPPHPHFVSWLFVSGFWLLTPDS